MATLRYDEAGLIRALKALPKRHRVIFALLCAERLAPGFAAFTRRARRGSHAEFLRLLDEGWRIGQRGADEGHVIALRKQVLELMPAEEEGTWVEPEQALAEDAVAALAYALGTAITGDCQEAAYAARRAYEAADYLAKKDLDRQGPTTEPRVADHPLVQMELSKQLRDLDDLASRGGEWAQLLELRARARQPESGDSSFPMPQHASLVQATMSRINKELLVPCLRELSDRDYQERAWSGSIPGVMSFFSELMCTIFDDAGLAEADDPTRDEELGKGAARLVRELDAATREVNARLPVPELVRSPEMERVRKLSSKILQLLDKASPPRSPG